MPKWASSSSPHEGTLERFTGDGMMIFFNDPVSCRIPPSARCAWRSRCATASRTMSSGWRKHGHDLALGIGIAKGFATIGAIGFEGRLDYGAVGTVTNLAARLCGEAKGGQILTNQKMLSQVEHIVDSLPVGELLLKGLSRPVEAYAILTLR